MGESSTAAAFDGIGRRISRTRRTRGLTQQGLADRAYVSRSLIQQVETGHKPATPSLVAAVSAALHVDPAEIYGQPYRGSTQRTDRVHATIPDMRRALNHIDVAPDLGTPPRPLDALAAEVATLRRLSLAARHVQVGTRISSVLEELTVHAYETDSARAWALMNATQAIAASLARRLGYNDLASFAMERAAAAAARSDDPNLPRLAQLSRALLMMTIGSWGPGLKLVRHAGDGMDRDTSASQAVFGALQLRAAMLLARAGRSGDAWEYYGVAKDVVSGLPARAPDTCILMREAIMRFLGKDPDSPEGKSPTVWDDGDDYVLQGFRITDAVTMGEVGEVPPHEAVIRFPKRMMRFFPEVNGAGTADV
jgi:transcriptional regulator with XRE-family HTH domain